MAGSKSPDAYAISNEALSKPEPYGIMLRKDDAPFKAVVDEATAKLYKSPEGKASTRSGSRSRSHRAAST